MIEAYLGLPGSGKSYAINYRAINALKKGKNVYTNFPVDGAYKLTLEMMKEAEFPPDTLLCIDEAGAYFSSRNWSEFPTEVYQLFSQHRKMNMDMLIAVQAIARVDLAIRELCNIFWWSQNPILPFFRYTGWYDINEIGRFEEHISYKNSFIPKRKKYFNSFDTFFQHLQVGRSKFEPEKWDIEKLKEEYQEKEYQEEQKEEVKKKWESLLDL